MNMKTRMKKVLKVVQKKKHQFLALPVVCMMFLANMVQTHAVVGEITEKAGNAAEAEINGGITGIAILTIIVCVVLLFFQQRKLAGKIFGTVVVAILIFEFIGPISAFLSGL